MTIPTLNLTLVVMGRLFCPGAFPIMASLTATISLSFMGNISGYKTFWGVQGVAGSTTLNTLRDITKNLAGYMPVEENIIRFLSEYEKTLPNVNCQNSVSCYHVSHNRSIANKVSAILESLQ
jgi:hypothetical protein